MFRPRPVLPLRNVRLVVLVNVRCGYAIGVDSPVLGILVPQDRCQVEALGDESDTVVDVSKGRPPALGSDTEDLLDRFSSVVQLCKGRLIVKRSHVLVRPRVDTNLVAVFQSPHSLQRPVHDVGTDVEPAVSCIRNAAEITHIVAFWLLSRNKS